LKALDRLSESDKKMHNVFSFPGGPFQFHEMHDFKDSSSNSSRIHRESDLLLSNETSSASNDSNSSRQLKKISYGETLTVSNDSDSSRQSKYASNGNSFSSLCYCNSDPDRCYILRWIHL